MADATENKTTTSDATNTTTTKSISKASKQDEVKQEQEKFLQQFQQFLQERQVIATTKRPREEDEVVEEDEETDEPDAKRQRLEEEPELYVLLVSYLGTGFFGLQINPTTITIESILLMALFKVDGAVPKTKRFMKSKLGGFGWQRSCRTDKGVHAIRNIVTCKMYPSIAERADFCDLVNAHLPDKIRVMSCKKVKSFFHPKNMCRNRTYNYVMPLYAISAPPNNVIFQSMTKHKVDWAQDADSLITKLNELLKKFEGVHFFHNFTREKLPDQGTVVRIMKRVEAQKELLVNPKTGKKYVLITIFGNSFMLHQIRLMLSAVICIMRGMAPPDAIEKALDKTLLVHLPKIPGVGLFLDRCEFTTYNKDLRSKYPSLDWREYPELEAELEKFKLEKVVPHIMEQEESQNIFMHWFIERFNKFGKYFKPRVFKPKNKGNQKNAVTATTDLEALAKQNDEADE